MSNKLVVTRCIHFYCWPYLYTWLEPSIEDRKYSAAFGGGGGGTRGPNFQATTMTMITTRAMVALALVAEEVEVEVEVGGSNV